jgi:hypothetical protein
MTAMSAPRAFETAGAENPFPELAHVRIQGSDRTYEVRDVLRGMGLRWDPLSHAWHGIISDAQRSILARQYGLKSQVAPPIEVFSSSPPPVPADASRGAAAVSRPADRPRTLHDGSRTRAEARVALPDAGQEDDAVHPRRFSSLEITSGMPDDSREADERAAEGRLRELRAQVKAARAVVATTPGLAERLACDRRKAARFYVRFGITEEAFRHGVPGTSLTGADDLVERLRLPLECATEAGARDHASLSTGGCPR